ncbi:hypothetical protein P9112_008992 [Eukaryota sp. TZLM1-RC]
MEFLQDPSNVTIANLDNIILHKENSLRELHERLATDLQTFFETVEQGLQALHTSYNHASNLYTSSKIICDCSNQVNELLHGNDWFALVAKVSRARHNMKVTLQDVERFGQLLSDVSSTFQDLQLITQDLNSISSSALDELHVKLVDLEGRRDSFLEGVPDANRFYINDSLRTIDDLRTKLSEVVLSMTSSIITLAQNQPDLIAQVLRILQREGVESPMFNEFKSKLDLCFEQRCNSVLDSNQFSNDDVTNDEIEQHSYGEILNHAELLETDLELVSRFLSPLFITELPQIDPLFLLTFKLHSQLSKQLYSISVSISQSEVPADEILVTVKWIGSYYSNLSRFGNDLVTKLSPPLMDSIKPASEKYLAQLENQLSSWIRSICKTDRQSILTGQAGSMKMKRHQLPTTPACTDILRLIVQTLSLHLRQDRGQFFQLVIDLCSRQVVLYVSLVKSWVFGEYQDISLHNLCCLANNFSKVVNNMNNEIKSLEEAAPRVNISSWDHATDQLLHGNAIVLRHISLSAVNVASQEVKELFDYYSESDGPSLRDFAGGLRVLLSPLVNTLEPSAVSKVVQNFVSDFAAFFADSILAFKFPITGIILGKLSEDVSAFENCVEVIFKGSITSKTIRHLLEPLRSLLTIFSLSVDNEQQVQNIIDLFDSYFKKMASIWSTATDVVAERILNLNSSLKSNSQVKSQIIRSVKNSLANPKMKPRGRGLGMPFSKICGLQEEKPSTFKGFEEPAKIPLPASAPISERKEVKVTHRRAVTSVPSEVVDSSNLDSLLS